MKKTITATALLATLALTGCAPKPIEFKAAPTVTQVEPSSVSTVNADDLITEFDSADESLTGKAWALEIVTLFLNGQGAHSFDAFEGDILSSVKNWDSTKPGVLTLVVPGINAYSKDDCIDAGMLLMGTAGYEAATLEAVEVVGNDGEICGSYSRKEMGNATPWG